MTWCSTTLVKRLRNDKTLLTQQSRPDQSLPPVGPDDLHFWLVGPVVFQLLLGVRHVGEVVHQDDLLDEARR